MGNLNFGNWRFFKLITGSFVLILPSWIPIPMDIFGIRIMNPYKNLCGFENCLTLKSPFYCPRFPVINWRNISHFDSRMCCATSYGEFRYDWAVLGIKRITFIAKNLCRRSKKEKESRTCDITDVELEFPPLRRLLWPAGQGRSRHPR